MTSEKLEGIKQGFTSLRESVADGGQRMRQSAAVARTQLRPGGPGKVPAKAEVDDDFYLPSLGCSAATYSMDERRPVVRLCRAWTRTSSTSRCWTTRSW